MRKQEIVFSGCVFAVVGAILYAMAIVYVFGGPPATSGAKALAIFCGVGLDIVFVIYAMLIYLWMHE